VNGLREERFNPQSHRHALDKKGCHCGMTRGRNQGLVGQQSESMGVL